MTSPEKSQALWQGRSSGRVENIVVEMGESISLDVELYAEDIQGSRAHARMLEKAQLISADDLSSILKGLDKVEEEIRDGRLPLRAELEDIHTHVETRLVEIAGEAGRRLHTARSRNDQIAVDTHLFVRKAAEQIRADIIRLTQTLLGKAEEHIDTIGPGYTHLQVAQPIRMSHYFLAHFWAFIRCADRFRWAADEARFLPLGSGALAGVNYPTDRAFLQSELGFDDTYANAMDAVSTRDHILSFLFACSTFAAHASRISEELILWSSVEFGFIELPDALTTGSSIMPQKKNPDLAELARGKTGRVFGNLQNLLVTMKGLPLAYNRDLQEDRMPLLDSRRQCSMIVRALVPMVAGMKLKPARMRDSLGRGYATATDLADALVREKGVPFRDAHHLAGRMVALCVEKGLFLDAAPPELRRTASEFFADDAFYFRAIDVAMSADKKESRGGTARKRQEEQISEAHQALHARGVK